MPPVDSPKIPADWSGQKVTVMGLGSFGGGIAVVRYLVAAGARVTVTDLRSEKELADSIEQLRETPPVRYVLGEHRTEDFIETAAVIVNPAVPSDHPLLQQAREAGVLLTSEIQLFCQKNPARLIGVTGSNGKSTTAAMTHALLEATGKRCWLGGNIGKSLLPVWQEIRPADWVVLELSSFQLEDLDVLPPAPEIAIITNFTPNHLDRHGTLEAYRSAKQGLWRWQQPDGVAILHGDDPDVREWPTNGRRILFGEQERDEEGVYARRSSGGKAQALCRFSGAEILLPVGDWIPVPGQHNLWNALSALAAVLTLSQDLPGIERGLRGYRALPHRLELVIERAGRRFYNDSLATTPESAQRGIESFESPLYLLAGGYDKGSDLSLLGRTIVERKVQGVALMGQTGGDLGKLIQAIDPTGEVRLYLSRDFPDAFEWCAAQSQPGDVILLSPGCASYGWFRNFVERGDLFRRLAQEWRPPAT